MATAQGIISVVTANMARAIRVISVQRGHDPRDYTLVAFGGAGPLHAARLAKELEIGRILVPRNPGILCAMGLLLTDLRADFAMTRLHTLSLAALPDVDRCVPRHCARRRRRGSRKQGSRRMRAGSRAPSTCATPVRTTNCRLPLPDGEIGPATSRRAGGGLRRRASADVRLRRRGRTGAAGHLSRRGGRGCAEGVVPAESRRRIRCVRRHRRRIATSGCRRPAASCSVRSTTATGCDAGNRIAGPAIVEQMDATTVVLPGMTARVEPYLNLILEAA